MARLKDVLENKLSESELSFIRGSFDIIGTIVLIEIPDELVKKEKLIAQAVLAQNSAVKTVLKKVGAHGGRYRTQKTKFLAGVKTKETIHKENGVLLKLNVEKCYFSPRLSTERMRVAQLIQPNESVLVMFSGVAPYPLLIAKHSAAKFIVGIEKNPVAHKYAVENLTLNKLSDSKIKLLCGDARTQGSKLKQKFDRIIMPLPKTAETFLDVAFKVIKKGGIIHLYQFCEQDKFDDLKEKIEKICKSENTRCKILGVFKAGQNAPRQYRVRVDIKIIS